MKTSGIVTALVGMSLVGSAAAERNQESVVDDLYTSSTNGFADRFTFGSYGELHGKIGDGTDTLDLHRLVLLTDIKLTDKLKFRSELEFEHTLFDSESRDKDEDYKIEIEQAYFEYALSDDLFLTGGVQLIPAGLINPTHEPTTFYGVERPNAEKNIIPSTWWEAGVGIMKTYDSGLQLDVLAHTSLDMNANGNIRSGRPKLDLHNYTEAKSWGVTARAKYTAFEGIQFGTSVQYQHDVSTAVAGSQNSFLLEQNAVYTKGDFQLRGMAAYWKFDGFASGVEDEQWGYYVEPSYKFDTKLGKLGVFGRYSQYKFADKSVAGKTNKYDEYTVGANLWITDEVVLKTDYSNVDTGSVNDETINFGMGYYF